MTVRIRNEQLGVPFSITSTDLTVSGTDSINISSISGTRILTPLDISTPEGSLLVSASTDLSTSAPFPPGTPGFLFLVPANGIGVLGSIGEVINTIITVVPSGSFLGVEGMMLTVDDERTSNTFSNGLTIFQNAVTTTASDISNSIETVIESNASSVAIKATDSAQGTEASVRVGLDYATVSGTNVVRVLAGTEVQVGLDSTHQVHINSIGVTVNGHFSVENDDARIENTYTHLTGIESGIEIAVTHDVSASGTIDFTYALNATTTALGDGHHTNVASVLAAVHFTGNGTATQALALDTVVSHHGSNTITNLYGGNFAFELTDVGGATNGFAVQIAAPTYSGTGRIGTNMGLYIANQGYSGQTASSAIVILDQSGSSILNNSIYAYGGKADFNVSNTAAADFNIHGQNDDNAFYMDVSADSLGLGTASPSSKLHIVKDDSTTNSVVDVLKITHSTTGTAADGIGTGLAFYSEDASGNIDEVGRINCKIPTAAHASQTGQMDLSAFGTTLISLFTGATATANRVTMGSAVNFQSYVPYFTLYDNGNSGNSKTIDWNNGIKQKITLTPTTNCVLSFTDPPGPAGLSLEVHQNSAGSKTVTWPGNVLHPGGIAPTLTTTASGTDIISFHYNGTSYMATSALDMRAS
jgi:hypothetical protein